MTGRTVADGCRGLVTGFGEGAAFAFLGGDAGFFGAVLAFEGFAALGFGFGAAAPWIESTPSMTGVPTRRTPPSRPRRGGGRRGAA